MSVTEVRFDNHILKPEISKNINATHKELWHLECHQQSFPIHKSCKTVL